MSFLPSFDETLKMLGATTRFAICALLRSAAGGGEARDSIAAVMARAENVNLGAANPDPAQVALWRSRASNALTAAADYIQHVGRG